MFIASKTDPFEGIPSGDNCLIDIGFVSLLNFCDHFASARVYSLESLSAHGIDELVVDEELRSEKEFLYN